MRSVSFSLCLLIVVAIDPGCPFLSLVGSHSPQTGGWRNSAETPHYGDVIIGAIASQIISLTIVYSTLYSDADQRKHQSSASLAFVLGIHRWPVNSPQKGPVTRKMFPFDDVIMQWNMLYWRSRCNLHTVRWGAVGCEWVTSSVYFGFTYVLSPEYFLSLPDIHLCSTWVNIPNHSHAFNVAQIYMHPHRWRIHAKIWS